jgi:hypothetical protein
VSDSIVKEPGGEPGWIEGISGNLVGVSWLILGKEKKTYEEAAVYLHDNGVFPYFEIFGSEDVGVDGLGVEYLVSHFLDLECGEFRGVHLGFGSLARREGQWRWSLNGSGDEMGWS